MRPTLAKHRGQDGSFGLVVHTMRAAGLLDGADRHLALDLSAGSSRILLAGAKRGKTFALRAPA